MLAATIKMRRAWEELQEAAKLETDIADLYKLIYQVSGLSNLSSPKDVNKEQRTTTKSILFSAFYLGLELETAVRPQDLTPAIIELVDDILFELYEKGEFRKDQDVNLEALLAQVKNGVRSHLTVKRFSEEDMITMMSASDVKTIRGFFYTVAIEEPINFQKFVKYFWQSK